MNPQRNATLEHLALELETLERQLAVCKAAIAKLVDIERKRQDLSARQKGKLPHYTVTEDLFGGQQIRGIGLVEADDFTRMQHRSVVAAALSLANARVRFTERGQPDVLARRTGPSRSR